MEVEGGGMTWCITQKGKNISDALSKLQRKVPREIILGTLQSICIRGNLSEARNSRADGLFAPSSGAKGKANVYVSQGSPKPILEIDQISKSIRRKS